MRVILRFGAIPQQADRMTMHTWWVHSQAAGEVLLGVQGRRA
jgi:hypothetical protein